MEEIKEEIVRIAQQSVYSYQETINATLQFLSKINNTTELLWIIKIFEIKVEENK